MLGKKNERKVAEYEYYRKELIFNEYPGTKEIATLKFQSTARKIFISQITHV